MGSVNMHHGSMRDCEVMKKGVRIYWERITKDNHM